MKLPTITLRPPWGDLIARHWKDLETREHRRFGGLMWSWIAIHQGKEVDTAAYDVAGPWLSDDRRQDLHDIELGGDWSGGCILAVGYVELAGWCPCCREEGPYEEACRRALCEVENLYGLWLRDVYALPKPVPARGRQGIWQWEAPAEAVEWIEEHSHGDVSAVQAEGDGPADDAPVRRVPGGTWPVRAERASKAVQVGENPGPVPQARDPL